MKPIVLTLFLGICLISCSNSKKQPDLSNIQVKLTVQRFDEDLFKIDTNDIATGIRAMQQKYPSFYKDFMGNILGIPETDPQAVEVVRQYIREFRSLYNLSERQFKDFSKPAAEVKELLRHVHYYFPKYALPEQLITFIGPMNAFYQNSLGWSGDIITHAGLGIGLQLHLGKSSPLYEQAEGRGYPMYIARRFEPEYISVNAAKNIIDDIHPMMDNKTLIDQMIDKGKRLYVLDQLLPNTADSLKIGYTGRQLEACKKNEALIWTYFLQNNLVFETDYQKIKPYISEGPNTQELGDDSPGFISLFVGKQIVDQFMEKHTDLRLMQLLEYDSRKLFEESKYKPKR